MTYRIVATLMLVLCTVAVGVALEYQEPNASPAPAASSQSPAADDSAMQSLRIP